MAGRRTTITYLSSQKLKDAGTARCSYQQGNGSDRLLTMACITIMLSTWKSTVSFKITPPPSKKVSPAVTVLTSLLGKYPVRTTAGENVILIFSGLPSVPAGKRQYGSSDYLRFIFIFSMFHAPYIDPLRTKLYPSDLKTQIVPRSKHSVPRI